MKSSFVRKAKNPPKAKDETIATPEVKTNPKEETTDKVTTNAKFSIQAPPQQMIVGTRPLSFNSQLAISTGLYELDGLKKMRKVCKRFFVV